MWLKDCQVKSKGDTFVCCQQESSLFLLRCTFSATGPTTSPVVVSPFAKQMSVVQCVFENCCRKKATTSRDWLWAGSGWKQTADRAQAEQLSCIELTDDVPSDYYHQCSRTTDLVKMRCVGNQFTNNLGMSAKQSRNR